MLSGQGPTIPLFRAALACLALASLALAGCDRGADTGATPLPVEPGRPGTGNPTVEVSPRPTSIPESPQIGGTTQGIPPGLSGSGTTNPGDASAQPRKDRTYPGGLGSDAPPKDPSGRVGTPPATSDPPGKV